MFDFDLDFLNDILENPLVWDKDSYKFNRPVKDMSPYSVSNSDKQIVITHNVLGIDKKDLHISIETEKGNNYIKIEGKTTDALTKKVYEVSSTFALNADELDLTKISSKMSNGLLYIIINKKEQKVELPKKRAIAID